MSQNVGYELSVQQRAALAGGLDAVQSESRCTIAVHGALDLDRLRSGLRAAVDRHEVLRTTFALPAGRLVPLQVVSDTGDVTLEVITLDGRDRVETPEFSSSRPGAFDPRRGPLVRLGVGRRTPTDHVLVLSAHAAVLDCHSLRLLAEELLGADIEEEPLQYAEYAAWQADLLADAEPPRSGDRSPTRLPLAGEPLAGGQRGRAPVQQVATDMVARGALGDPGSVWPALWVALIARASAAERVTLAFEDHGRPVPEVERALGPFARRLPVTIDVPAGMRLPALVRAIAAARASVERDREIVGARPPAATLVGCAVDRAGEAACLGGRELTTLSSSDREPALQLDLVVTAGGPAIEYDDAAVGGEAARRLAARLATLAVNVAADADADLRVIDVLPDGERRWLVDDVGRGPELEVAEPCVHHRFEEHAALNPDRPAVAGDGAVLSYRQLNDCANRVAHALRARGVARGATVALLLERTPSLIAAMLGALKAGAAYLPLNPDHPVARTRSQIDDAGASLALVDGANEPLAGRCGVPRLRIDTLAADLPRENPPWVSRPDDIAYLIYTSGSTGEPKGVETTHAALGNYVAAVSHRFGWGDEPLHFGLVTTLSTDLGNTSVFPALASGSCLELVPVDAAMDGAAYAAHVRERPIDVLKVAPSHLRGLLTGGGAAVLPRRRLVLGGEALAWSLVDEVRELAGCAIANHYGPTETTVGSLTYDVGRQERRSGTVPVGRPLANTTVAVVDAGGRLVAPGTPGALLIGGAGLARGYRGRPEQTAGRFRSSGVQGGPAGRVYETGDVARVLADGTIEFLGRADEQIKVRGLRVEPGEVEAALTSHRAVERAAVVARHDPRGERQLVAYVVADRDRIEDLLAHVREQLPDAMIPSSIVALDAFPLLASGKLDRASLPAPESAGAPGPVHVAPQTRTEVRLAAIWSDVLSLDRIGRDDDFFALGGHSLLAMQVVAQTRTAFDVQLPLHCLFTAPRIVDLAREIDLLSERDGEAAELARIQAEIEQLSDEEVVALLQAEDVRRAT